MAEFEERADQLSLSDIESTLSDGQIFRAARRKLLTKGAKLLVGPRGTGKTHLMRYTYLQAMKDPQAPLAAYANFSRYLSLEPLLKRSPDALSRFHSWVVGRLLISAFDLIADIQHSLIKNTDLIDFNPLLDEAKIREFVALIERSAGATEYDTFGRYLTVDIAVETFHFLAKKYKRDRVVLLLDDAALSLTDEYLIAFFEVFRLLKTEHIAPKASVYPGSTQYGPRFHASHETQNVELWLSVEDPEYLAIMGDIGNRRMSQQVSTIPNETLDHFKYIAFGSPRAYLRMVREFVELQSGTAQSKINRVTDKQVDLLWSEYDSLAIKLKQFASVIKTGRSFIEAAVRAMVKAKDESGLQKNLILGVLEDADRSPLAERMLRFLVEVGLLYPFNSPVSHGKNRRYDRYIIHLAFLHAAGTFRLGRGTSPKDLPSYMQRPSAKHPVRTHLSGILGPEHLSHLVLDLPPCQRCHTPRISESQKFCHQCGEQLVIASLFEQCMGLPLSEVPGISLTLLDRLKTDTKLRTVGDVYSSQSPGADLQKASYIGPKRASGIIEAVGLVVGEFLS